MMTGTSPHAGDRAGDGMPPGMRRNLAEFAHHFRRRWYLYLPLLAIWGLAYARLFVDPTPRLPVLFSWSPSLPYRIALVRPARGLLERGDYIVFAFAGEAQQVYSGLQGQPFFKRVRGLPGDRVAVEGRAIFINDELVGIAKTHAQDRHPLEPIAATVIPPGHYYVQGTSPDSFDSRYSASGLVRVDQVIATVVPIF